MDRRFMLKTAGSLAGLVALGQITAQAEEAPTQPARRPVRPRLQFNNADFYGPEGKFLEEKGKDAILRLCRFHGYPVFPGMRENLWVSDYATGQYAQLGLAAYIFANNVEAGYMMLDIFLLPGQMLPEHWHEPTEGKPAKMEGWLVRWGASHIVGEGEPNLSQEIVIPKCHFDGKVTVEHEVLATPGMFVPLAKVGSPHWQYGGPQGAIITEVANLHVAEGVRHRDPAMNEYFLKATSGG